MNQVSIQQKIIQSLIGALTVSFVALSLGAAFGVLSGRGAFAGMISAAIIASVTSLLGGTRIQCSGPTGPMTTVMAAVTAFATSRLIEKLPSADSDQFLNITLLLTAGFLLIFGILRLGKFISFIPNVVISGFMNGIAIIIWMDQVKRLFGLGGKAALTGSLFHNALVLVATAFLAFTIPMFTKRFLPKFASLLSGTFLAILIMTGVCLVARLDVEQVSLATSLKSWQDFVELLNRNFPAAWSAELVWLAIPFAIQLAVLGYLDTLMTSLVIDKMMGETTKPNKELIAQGVAHVGVALVGGIAGAQATIRSVIMVKEGVAYRWAGVLVGVFALAEMLVFQDWIKLIPQAVFAGILIKVGYDVFDWTPLRLYAKSIFTSPTAGAPRWLTRDYDEPIAIRATEISLISGTALVTVFWDLNVAVAVFTALFYLYNNWLSKANPMHDLKLIVESESFSDED